MWGFSGAGESRRKAGDRMNYGKKNVERRLEELESIKTKCASKILLMFYKLLLVLAAPILVMGCGAGAGIITGILDNAPAVDLLNIQPDRFATTVYDSAGNVTETLVASGANREAAVYEELPEDLVNAFVAIEDARFWEHSGIDVRSIGRAAVGIISGNYSGGGSTITQQLIKNNVLDGGMETSWGARIERKIQEQYMAVRLEKNSGMEKEETKRYIITNYLNTINLGNNALGVKVAARRYFGKEVSELTLSECTVLAPIAQSPSRMNPLTGREANEGRRRIVLEYMYEQGYITREEQAEALADPVYERIQNVNVLARENETPYSYFTDELISQVIEALVTNLDYTENQAENLLYSGGLQIHTTQDPEIQKIVDEEVNNPDNYESARYSAEYRLSILHGDGTAEHYSERDLTDYRKKELRNFGFDGLYDSEEELYADIDSYKEWLLEEDDQITGEHISAILQPQVSFVVMDQATGEVKAISGGRGAKEASLTLNRATAAPRQPGSAFKVLTAFAPALDAFDAALGTVFYDAPYTVQGKAFRNWWGESRGYMGYSNIRDGIVYSMNIVAVRAMMENGGPGLGVDYARNMGITTLTSQDLNPSTALGGITNGVTNLELTAAYGAIANNGVYTAPRFFTRILDRNGQVLVDNRAESRQVLKDSTAFLLTDAMEESLNPHRLFAREGVSIQSTSTRAALDQMSAAGKSGTTTNNVDVWFVGYTPYYTAGIWGGCDDNQSLRSGNVNNGGTNFHKDIWRQIMNRIHEGLPDPGFQVPASVEQVQICKKSGKLAIPGVCDHDPRGNAVYTEYFSRSTVPSEMCDTHASISICPETGQAATEYCPERETRVFMVLPAGETGTTDDSYFAVPGACAAHTEEQAVVNQEDAAEGNTETYITPLGPGWIQ